MRVRFYGVRGSIPVPLTDNELREKLRSILLSSLAQEPEKEKPAYLKPREAPRGGTYGGNTSCVEAVHASTTVILDAGSGLRVLGLQMMQQQARFTKPPLYLLVSHFHWDHIQGFPFFEPAYQPGNQIEVWSGLEGVEEALSKQMSAPFFPMRLEGMGADISFHYLPPGEEVAMGDFQVSLLPLVHPGGASGFKLSAGGKRIVYFTDTELFACDEEQKNRYREFVDGCDLLVADTQYERREAGEKMDWGHSSATAFIDLVKDLRIESLALFHYDPKYDDDKIDAIFREATLHKEGVSPKPSFRLLASYEGLEIQV